MTPVDEALARVKAYVESWSSDEPDTAIITDPLDADDPVVTLGDLRRGSDTKGRASTKGHQMNGDSHDQ